MNSADIFKHLQASNFPAVRDALTASPELWAAADSNGATLLHWAAHLGSAEFTKAALRNGIQVDARTDAAQTPLMWAACRGNLPAVRVLLDAGSDARSSDAIGMTSAMLAIKHFEHHVLLLLLHRGGTVLLSDVDVNGWSAVHWAAFAGNATALRLLDYFQIDLQVPDNANTVALHHAVIASRTNVVEFLISRQSSPNWCTGNGETCMDIARRQNDAIMIAVLERLKNPHFVAAENASRGFGAASPLPNYIIQNEFSAWSHPMIRKMLAVFWHICILLAVTEYFLELRSQAWAMRPLGAVGFEFGVVMSLVLFYYVVNLDAGLVPHGERGSSGVEEVMRFLDTDLPEGHRPDLSRLCPTTWIWKGPRTKYCAMVGSCVRDFDHFCFALDIPIGAGNHRAFLILALVELSTQLSHLYLCWRANGGVESDKSLSAQSAGGSYSLLTAVWILHCCTAPGVFMLIVAELGLVAWNLRVNEVVNSGRYKHFWTAYHGSKPVYKNPFCKGTLRKNCMDFWLGWLR